MPVQEQDRAEGLVLRAFRQPTIDRQMGEERLDFLLPHLSGMNPMAGAIVMKPQKLLDPAAVGLNGSLGQAADFAGRPILFEEFHLHSLPRKNCSVNSRSGFDASPFQAGD